MAARGLQSIGRARDNGQSARPWLDIFSQMSHCLKDFFCPARLLRGPLYCNIKTASIMIMPICVSMCMIMPTEANVTLKDFKNKEGNAEVIFFQISNQAYHVFCYFEYQEMRKRPEVYVEFQKAKNIYHIYIY